MLIFSAYKKIINVTIRIMIVIYIKYTSIFTIKTKLLSMHHILSYMVIRGFKCKTMIAQHFG